MNRLALILACSLALSGCPTMPKPPSGPLELIEASEVTARQIQTSLVGLTCTQFVTPTSCAQPGKVFLPDTALKYHDQVDSYRKALRSALEITEGGVGQCLGEKRTQAACIATARLLLNELQRNLAKQQQQGTLR